MNERQIQELVAKVVVNFPHFGGEQSTPPDNPIAEMLNKKPPTFAVNVSIEEVVRFVVGNMPR